MDQDKNEDGWAALPWVPLLETFALLDRPAHLARAGLVCRTWHAAATDNRLWRHLCLRDWRIRRPLGASQTGGGTEGVHFKALYADMVNEHGEYRALYARVSDMWEAYESWLAVHAPLITLMPAATPEGVRQLEQVLAAELPLDLKCALRIRNGQNLTRLPGLLGGYSFYDHRVEMQLMGVSDMRSFSESILRHVRNDSQVPRWLAHVCPIARSKSLGKVVFVLMQDLEGHGKRGNVVANSEDYRHTFFLARDYVSYLSDHLAKLQSGAYKAKKGHISLFPQPGARGVGVATTHGITVEAAPLFVPEKSSLASNPPSYFWAYQIRMHMPADCSARPSRLKSRHWVITSGQEVQEVRGRGVIGLYPVMEPGAYFEYESCCPQPTPHGTMRGSFTMEYLDTREEFEVVVPEFEFFLPPGSRLDAP